MEDLRKSKRERSKAKQLITVTSRQLTRCIQRKGDMSKIESFYNDLERQYTDFIVLDGEYKDLVNSDEQNNAYKIMENMDLDKYTEHVEDLYNEAIDAYNTPQQFHFKHFTLKLNHRECSKFVDIMQ